MKLSIAYGGPRKLVATGLVLSVLAYLALLLEPRVMWSIAGKEQLLEGLGAALFFGSSLLCFATWRATRSAAPFRSRRRLVYLLLGVFFFVAAGEELSWGQHLLGFSTPPSIAELNRQAETNIHNLWIFDTYDDRGRKKTGIGAVLNSNRLFDYFMLGLFLVTPCSRLVPALNQLLVRFGVPLLPVAFVLPLLLNFALTATSELWLVDARFKHIAVSEIREFNYALLCFLGVLHLYLSELARSRPQPAASRTEHSPELPAPQRRAGSRQ